MKSPHSSFSEQVVLHELKHYLPAQVPLKDFIPRNPLYAFQEENFHESRQKATEIFGYQTSPSLNEFREYYRAGRIREDILTQIIVRKKGEEYLRGWLEKAISKEYPSHDLPRIGTLRVLWKRHYQVDLDALVHPTLFRVLCSFLDQGIADFHFPVLNLPFLASIREMERHSLTSFFRTERARNLLLYTKCGISDLLLILVGDESLYKHYLFDQQFAHPGWSGLVATIEDQPETLRDSRQISLHDLIFFELLLDIDALDFSFGEIWAPLGIKVQKKPRELFASTPETELAELTSIWQEACEWSCYEEILAGISLPGGQANPGQASFQAMFCLDEQEILLRQYLQQTDTNCETFGTPGFFNVATYYKPQRSQFHVKVCPASFTPTHLIKELGPTGHKQDAHRREPTHTLLGKWLATAVPGFRSAFGRLIDLFYPTLGSATTSLPHMGNSSRLTIEHDPREPLESGLQVGYTAPEMAQRVEGLLRSTGLVRHFASLVYVVGHGSGLVNDPYHTTYNCSACHGRPGSVNARAICYMANHVVVREILRNRGIDIPDTTQFLGGLHDTARDEIAFYDLDILSSENQQRHQRNMAAFNRALNLLAPRRSERSVGIDTNPDAEMTHDQLRRRTTSLREPRPEPTHLPYAFCIVGRRSLTQNLFLGRGAFLNSFDYRVDPTGQYLLDVLKAITPLCGAINLEYFFSRVGRQKLGAGAKLPHHVMGLVGVAHGTEGDLRSGPPGQMVEKHAPVRLLFVVEHFPDLVLSTIQKVPATYDWFANEWGHLAVIHPETRKFSVFRNGAFTEYKLTQRSSEPRPVPDELPIDSLSIYVLPKGEKQLQTEKPRVTMT